MKNKKPKITIITKTYNHASFLKRYLKRLKIQKNIPPYEILVIDSSSTDGTKEIAEKEGCKVVSLDPRAFTHAYTFNLGAEKAQGEIIIYASVDVIPLGENYLSNLLKHFKNKNVAGVFGRQKPLKNFNHIEEFKTNKMFNEKNTQAFFSGSHGALRKKVWKKIKFPENVPYQYIGGEDQIWAKRVISEGYKIIYEPKSIVMHSHKYPLKTRLNHAYMGGKYEKEIKEWNKNVGILNYSKIDLIFFLIKNKAFKELFIDLLFAGILMRIWKFKGKIDSKKELFL